MTSIAEEARQQPATWYERHWRWFVVGALFLATFLNYFDRQTLGAAMDPIAAEFKLSNEQRGDLLSAFIFSYAFCHLFIGFIVDRVHNVRRFFPLMLPGWSVSTMLVGFSRTAEQIYWLRVLLGVRESVNFPICRLIIRRIFPAEERPLAAGIFASGAFLATLAAPPVVIYFANHLDWRYSFFVAGALGLLWLIPWFLIFRSPHARLAGSGGHESVSQRPWSAESHLDMRTCRMMNASFPHCAQPFPRLASRTAGCLLVVVGILGIQGLPAILTALSAAEVPAAPASSAAAESKEDRGFTAATAVALRDGRWMINGQVTYHGAQAEGLLMNVRMVNATFEDRHRADFDPDANTDAFLKVMPEYVSAGVRAFTFNLQGGMPGYEGALNSAFEPDGSLRPSYLTRLAHVIEACDRQGVVVILGCYYQRQDQVLRDEDSVRRGLVATVRWVTSKGYRNVVLEVANEFGHGGFDHTVLRTPEGQAELIDFARRENPRLLIATSGLGSGRIPAQVAAASDFLLPHFNSTPVEEIPQRIQALKAFGKPIVCNEDEKSGAEAAEACRLSVENGVSYGLMLRDLNQYQPFEFHGCKDDPLFYDTLRSLTEPRPPLVRFPSPFQSPHRVDPEWPFQLVNQEGEHLFILNKTAWAYFGCSDPERVLDRARSQGVNVLRVALEGSPYWETLGIELWPYGGSRDKPDWNSSNDSYWNVVEQRVRLAGEKGIGLDVVLNMRLHPQAEEVPQQRAYWRETLRRIGKYANVLTWEIANEHTANETFQEAAGSFFKAQDPHRRPVCTSAGTTDDAVWPDKPWIDLAINHTCTSSTSRHDLRDWYLALARNTRSHGKPAFSNETGREKRHRNDDGVHRRKQGWLWCAAGGFWTWHSWDGCEGINDLAYRAPGEEFLKPMADTFQSIPFWRMNPNFTACVAVDEGLVQAALATADRSHVLAYFAAPESGAVTGGSTAQLRLPGGTYRLKFLRPADGSVIETREYTAKGLGDLASLELPQFTDDLVVLAQRTGAGEQTVISGTQ